MGWDAASGQEANASPVWTSHEMLLLDYELSMLREDEQRRVYLGSTHWPWIGERTRQVDGAHELFVEDGCGGLWTTDTGSPIVIRGKDKLAEHAVWSLKC
ncbi:PhzA/PhzB family protein, partial [Pseudomonas aeruginosa]|uniref:PhzA/PhzB family protein n=1 Tax=Pseudomonas aeruginosa TaxID=287 RepID=UPI001F0975E0